MNNETKLNELDLDSLLGQEVTIHFTGYVSGKVSGILTQPLTIDNVEVYFVYFVGNVYFRSTGVYRVTSNKIFMKH